MLYIACLMLHLTSAQLPDLLWHDASTASIPIIHQLASHAYLIPDGMAE